MNLVASIVAGIGCVSLLIGYLGILFCGFEESLLRGIRNLILPILGFGDAMRRFPFLIWLWAGGIGAIALSSLLSRI